MKVITFGKHRGKTIADVAFDDPDYVIWFFRQKNLCEEFKEDLIFVITRLSRIKIPDEYGLEYEVEILQDRRTKKFYEMAIVPKSTPIKPYAHRYNYINLFAPAFMKGYDKTGCKIMIKHIKSIVFKNSRIYLTAKRINLFLSNDSNFVQDVIKKAA